MPSYYCTDCDEQRQFLNVKRTAELAQVTRATVYNWLKKASLHVIVHPSGRKYICTASILAVGPRREDPAHRPQPATHSRRPGPPASFGRSPVPLHHA